MELDVRRSIRQQLDVLRSAGVQQLPLGCGPVAPTADTLESAQRIVLSSASTGHEFCV